MDLFIVCSKNDLSAERILEAAKKKFNSNLVFYNEISEIPDFDFCILRDPYTSGDFSELMYSILKKSKGRTLDYSVYSKYPNYEDKFFQQNFFSEFGMPKYWEIPETFPILAKKRISSRGKGLFILETKKDFEDFSDKKDYIFVKMLDVVKDIRVFVLGGKVICSVERKVRFKEKGSYKGIGVKVIGSTEISKEVEKKSLAIAKKIGSDFCGLDFVIDKNGKEYFIECNISPQFKSTEKVLGIDIVGMLVDFIENKLAIRK